MSRGWSVRSAIVLIVSIAVATTACTTGQESAEPDGSAPASVASSVAGTPEASEAALEPLRIATNANANFTNLAVFYAVEEGLFENRGYDAELVPVPDDATGIRGLVSNEFSVLSQGVGAAITAASQGGDIVLVSSIAPHVDYQFVATEGIGSLQELEGKTVGVSSPGAISEQVPKLILEKNGIDLNSVSFVAIGGDADRARALAAGQIDAAVVNTVNTVAALDATPSLHVLVNAGEVLAEDFLLTGVATTQEVIDSDPELVQAVVSALIEASRILQSDSEEAAAFGISVGMPEDATAEAYDQLTAPDTPFFGVDGGLSESAFDSTVQSLLESGSLTTSITWDEMVDTSFIDAAIEELGEF